MSCDIAAYRRIALIGAGGKTTLSESLAFEFARREACVALTTTTRILLPDTMRALIMPSEQEIAAAWETANLIAVCGEACGMDERTGRVKVRGPNEETLCYLAGASSRLIMEADGARGRLLKLHGNNEPVLPEETELVLIVASMMALGKPLGEVCHREERIGDVLGREKQEHAAVSDIVHIIAASDCGACMNRYAILNRVTEKTRRAAEQIAACLQTQYGMGTLLLPELSDERTRRGQLGSLLLHG